MAVLSFAVPHRFDDLLKEDDENYYVKEIIDVSELPEKIRVAKLNYADEGVQFITEHFDTYYSVIYHRDSLDTDKLLLVYKHLEAALSALTQNVKFLLDDAENLADEVKLKYQMIIKMLLYLFCQHIIALENKFLSKDIILLKKKGKKRQKSDDEESFDKQSALVVLNMLLQCDLHVFWDPPVVENQMIYVIAEPCYPLLENSSSKDLHHQIFDIFGILLKTYNYDESFLIRLVQLLKVNQHLVKPIAEGLYQLVDGFGVKGLIGEFIREIMEFLMEERNEDAEGTRNCTAILLEMSKLLPQLMSAEVEYLTKYLGHESPALRVAVLTVMTEVLIILSTKPDLEDSEKILKDFIPKVLLEHVNDVAVTVRFKVIQIWAKLQKENVLSTRIQNDVLREIVDHIWDKGSSARKAAASCIVSFLEHNCYGSELSFKQMQTQYKTLQKKFQDAEEHIKKNLCPDRVAAIDERWNLIEADILKVMRGDPKNKGTPIENGEEMNGEENNEDGEETEERDDEIPEEQPQNQSFSHTHSQELIPLIKVYLEAKQYKEVITLCKKLIEEFPEYLKIRETDPEISDEQLLVGIMKRLHYQMTLQIELLVDPETIKKMDEMQESVKYYEEAMEFAQLLDEAIPKMKQLLTCVNITEMQEAVKFFVTAYKFQLDCSEHGILELLNVMKLPFDERKEVVVNALVEVFLTTTLTSNMKEHTKVIVERLIRFIRIVTYDYRVSFQQIIAQWTLKGKLDNNILDMLFSYFTKKENVTEDQSLAALQVLTLAAHGRRSIVVNNLKMVCEVVFQNRGLNDMILIAETCNFLAVGGSAKQRIDDDKPPYRLSWKEPVWEQLSHILVENFSKPVQFYDAAAAGAIRMIYNLCAMPEKICQDLIMRIMKLEVWSSPTGVAEVPIYQVNRLNFILGKVALYETAHLDDTVYTEIKRRCHKEAAKVGKKRNDLEMTRTSARKRVNKTAGTGGSSACADLDESIMEGAQAEDTDAQFILNTLDYKIVLNTESLGAFTPFFLEVCRNLNKFPNEQMQCGSVLVLLRYMIMSQPMCSLHVELIFKILATTQYMSLKRLIIINLADLLIRFPNIIDPYSSHIFEMLSYPDVSVQKTAYFILGNMLTRSMLRINKKVYAMILPMVPEQTPLSDMSKQFFSQLGKNHQMQLYNIIPDLFSYLCGHKDVSEDQLKYVMRYLFDLLDKAKYVEGLVDRFCVKLINNENERVLKNIGFCLHLIQYNDKSARKLLENFPQYKDALHNSDLHAYFKQIMSSWSKATKYNLKEVANELEQKILEFFHIEDIQADTSRASNTSTVSNRSCRRPNRGRRRK